MWLSLCQPFNSAWLKQRLGLATLWRYPGWALLAMYAGIFMLLIFFLLVTAFSVLTWQHRHYLTTKERLESQVREIIADIRPQIGRGSWMGITVMPALASTLPPVDLRTQVADLQFLHQLTERFQVGDARIHPLQMDAVKKRDSGWATIQEQGVWRHYEIRFLANASRWLALIRHLALAPGIRLHKQVWDSGGHAVLQLGVAGQLPVLFVGQVGGAEGESRLVLQDGRLQRVGDEEAVSDVP